MTVIVSDTEWADMQRSLAYHETQNAKLVEGVCLLGDTLLAAFHSHSMWEQTPETRAAAKPLKDVILAAHDAFDTDREYASPDAEDAAVDEACERLDTALAHPAIAALIDAWATKEG